ncbi:hypothetical protein Tco_0127768 [Tanacetum coccineum]
MMDVFTKEALWDYWKMGGDEIEITKTIGSMNGTKIYHGLMRNHGLKLEFRQNRNPSKILASLSTIKLGVRNGQPVVGERMDTVIEALEDSRLKDEALQNKAIMEGLISDDLSSNDC